MTKSKSGLALLGHFFMAHPAQLWHTIVILEEKGGGASLKKKKRK